MIKINEYKRAIIDIIALTKIVNPEIGSYKEHLIDDSFIISVILTNGDLDMIAEIAQDYEVQPSSITQDQIETIAKTFRKRLK